jgi:hypothetical protein
MELKKFKEIIPRDPVFKSLHPLQMALLKDKNNDWDGAHQIAQKDTTHDGCWLHAYLHRKEGDVSNARYWYNRAGKPVSDLPLDKEWEELAIYFLNINLRNE